MRYLVQVHGYTFLGNINAQLTVRQESPEGTTELVLAIATEVQDDGSDDPVSVAKDALVGLLEVL